MNLFTLLSGYRRRGHTIMVFCGRVHRKKEKIKALKKQLRVYLWKDIEWLKTLRACLVIQSQFEKLTAENEQLRRQLAAAEEMSYREEVAALQARVFELVLQRRALLKTQWTPPEAYTWPPLQKLLQWRMAYLRYRGDRAARL